MQDAQLAQPRLQRIPCGTGQQRRPQSAGLNNVADKGVSGTSARAEAGAGGAANSHVSGQDVDTGLGSRAAHARVSRQVHT